MSIRSVNSIVNSFRDPAIDAAHDLQQQVDLVQATIASMDKVKKKLRKIGDELARANFLIDSGVGNRADKEALRLHKRQLRQNRVQIRKQLEPLPALEEELQELTVQLNVLRRRHGIVL